jgi:hypothetical protein
MRELKLAPPQTKTSQNQKEELINLDRLKNFNPDTCAAKMLLTELYGPINGQDLLSLAKVCSHYLNIYLDREASRRKVVLMKWFDENIMDIEPFLRRHIVIENEVEPLGPPALVDQVGSSARRIKEKS